MTVMSFCDDSDVTIRCHDRRLWVSCRVELVGYCSLRSCTEFMEQFSKIQEAFQCLEKSYVEVKACRREIHNKEDDNDGVTKQG